MFWIDKGQFGFIFTSLRSLYRGATMEMSQLGVMHKGLGTGKIEQEGKIQQLKGGPRMRVRRQDCCGEGRRAWDEGEETGLLWGGEEGQALKDTVASTVVVNIKRKVCRG